MITYICVALGIMGILYGFFQIWEMKDADFDNYELEEIADFRAENLELIEMIKEK